MTLYMATVKIENNPHHNPRGKVQGECPVSHGACSDTTGAHHTLLVDGAGLTKLYGTHHITRIEEVK